jgi:hypothetical protein
MILTYSAVVIDVIKLMSVMFFSFILNIIGIMSSIIVLKNYLRGYNNNNYYNGIIKHNKQTENG